MNASSDNAATARGQTASPLRVLIADDNRDTVMTLGILLRSEGFDVRLAEGGSGVPDAVHEFQPHAILLDIVMPDRNGLEVARELKQRYGKRCPILIAITGQNTDEARLDATHSGFKYFVAKPYNPDALLKLVTSLHTMDAQWRCAE